MRRLLAVGLRAAALALSAGGMTSLGAQSWCVPSTAIPYGPNMPGITLVAVGTINRTSAAIEDFPRNSYVNTGATTTLTVGQTYTITIRHTRDSAAFPGARNNIRVWIDYNRNGSFADEGEAVVVADGVAPGTSTFTFQVPDADAPAAETRMRVTAKMSADAGHSMPTPCDDPPDRLKYHGEFEDYGVTIAKRAPNLVRVSMASTGANK